MNLAAARLPVGYASGHTREQGHLGDLVNIGRVREELGITNEAPAEFAQRIRAGLRQDPSKYALQYLAHSFSVERYCPLTARAYVLAELDTTDETSTTMAVRELYVDNQPVEYIDDGGIHSYRSDRGKGLAGWMLHRLAFAGNYDQTAPTSMTMPGWVSDFPGFAQGLHSAGFRPDEQSGLLSIRLPGRYMDVAWRDYDEQVKELPFGWNGVLEVAGSLRCQPGFQELYRDGEPILRVSESVTPAGVIIHSLCDDVQNMVLPSPDIPLLFDDEARQAILEALNPA